MVDCLVSEGTGRQMEAVEQVEIVSPPPQVCAERNINTHIHIYTHAHTWYSNEMLSTRQ